MKEKVIFTTALCLSAMTPMMAQNITGKVMNTKGEPLAFANVVLLNRTDSAFVKGAVSGEDGSFAIDSSCNGGIIKVTSVGYKTVCKDCEGENIGIIKMEEDSEMVYAVIKSYKGVLPFTDKADPELIKQEFGLSKNAFKRAVGRLLKEGRIKISEKNIEMKKK